MTDASNPREDMLDTLADITQDPALREDGKVLVEDICNGITQQSNILESSSICSIVAEQILSTEPATMMQPFGMKQITSQGDKFTKQRALHEPPLEKQLTSEEPCLATEQRAQPGPHFEDHISRKKENMEEARVSEAFYVDNQRPEAFYVDNQRPEAFYVDNQRPEAFYVDNQRPEAFYVDNQRPEAFYVDNQRPEAFYVDNQRPVTKSQVSEQISSHRSLFGQLRTSAEPLVMEQNALPGTHFGQQKNSAEPFVVEQSASIGTLFGQSRTLAEPIAKEAGSLKISTVVMQAPPVEFPITEQKTLSGTLSGLQKASLKSDVELTKTPESPHKVQQQKSKRLFDTDQRMPPAHFLIDIKPSTSFLETVPVKSTASVLKGVLNTPAVLHTTHLTTSAGTGDRCQTQLHTPLVMVDGKFRVPIVEVQGKLQVPVAVVNETKTKPVFMVQNKFTKPSVNALSNVSQPHHVDKMVSTQHILSDQRKETKCVINQEKQPFINNYFKSDSKPVSTNHFQSDSKPAISSLLSLFNKWNGTILCDVTSSSIASKNVLYNDKQRSQITTTLPKNRYVCDHCTEDFRYLDELERHIRNHLTFGVFYCQVCDKGLTTKYHLKLHRRTHMPKRTYECSECSNKFKTERYLQYHMTDVHNQRIRRCFPCDKIFSERDFKRHNALHLKEQNTCPVCKKQFRKLSEMKQHEAIHLKQKYFLCEICKKSYRTSYYLDEHMAKVHNKPVQEIKEKKLSTCDVCGKSFKDNDSLKQHMRIHQEKQFLCDKCDKKFIFRHHLQNHLKSHSDERNHQCDTCGAKFKMPHHLRNHIVTHV